jgi:hypothetical protein
VAETTRTYDATGGEAQMFQALVEVIGELLRDIGFVFK